MIRLSKSVIISNQEAFLFNGKPKMKWRLTLSQQVPK